MVRASGTDRASRSSLVTTNVSPARRNLDRDAMHIGDLQGHVLAIDRSSIDRKMGSLEDERTALLALDVSCEPIRLVLPGNEVPRLHILGASLSR